MRTVKSPRRAAALPDPFPQSTPGESDGQEAEAYERYEILRVVCPDCSRPIALPADQGVLPEHALCPTPWDPFGLTVCQGSGRAASEALRSADASADARDGDAGLRLTLPEGLDWRTQPFSHVGGPASRPMRPVRRRQPVRAGEKA